MHKNVYPKFTYDKKLVETEFQYIRKFTNSRFKTRCELNPDSFTY